jgi:F-type H+-transporting ATPase subunit a
MVIICSPLEQFRVLILFPLAFGLDFSITNATVYMVLVMSIIYGLIVKGSRSKLLVPTVLQGVGELMYIGIHNIVKQQVGLKGLVYLPVMLITFYMVMLLNLVGLVPYAFTCTSQMCYTMTLGFGMFTGIVIVGVLKQKGGFLKQFVPNTTGPLVPLLILIEVFSYCIRPFSLSIRLFANMLAGHTLLSILGAFGVSLYKVTWVFGVVMSFPILAVFVLEVGIAFLQAYVFVVMLCIYLKDSLYGH